MKLNKNNEQNTIERQIHMNQQNQQNQRNEQIQNRKTNNNFDDDYIEFMNKK